MKEEKTPAHSATSVGYRLAKLLKHLDNRLCADCGVSLLEWQNYYASLSNQVWLCNTCYESHVEVLGEGGVDGKRIKDDWTDEEITIMERAVSNVTVNKILERYTNNEWKKLTPESSYTERIQWIRAKYQSKYFTIPPVPAIASKKKKSKEIGHSTTLPMRSADYFITLGPGKVKGKATAAKSVTDLLFGVEVQSSFPNEQFYTDQPSPVPDLLGPMVFPRGLRMSRKEERPYCYSFVLTDTYRVKQFGTALVVHELIDPHTLEGLMSRRRQSIANRDGVDHDHLQDLGGDKVLYAPKALVVISHYPFFHLFTRFLEQLYHLSLSSSPLPIERYIANFILELPLPPQGRIEVLFSLPESQLQISRPPRNQLPMVDFSYRPLFAYLSVDNILAVFACLCQEMSICICAKNVALLTPVQESLISLLFPFVWQGCYVPVLPADMIELLHAPVPLLTGMQVDDISETFLDDDPNMRPSNLVIVHLDTDTIHYGSDCRPLPLPKAMLPKLRQKLVEHGSCLYQQPDELVLLSNAELLYPNDEHMRPMKHFIAAQGVLSSIHPRSTPNTPAGPGLPPPAKRLSNFGTPSGARPLSGDYPDDASDTSAMTATSKKSTGFGLRQFYTSTPVPPKVPAKDQKYQHVSSHHHPAACSLDAGTRHQAGVSFSTRRYALDPAYNYQPDMSQIQSLPAGAVDFNAMEIRGAFLRFFVAAFIDYEEFFSDYAARTKEAALAEKNKKAGNFAFQRSGALSVDGARNATLSQQSLDSTSRPKSDVFAMNGSAAPAAPPKTFDQNKFLTAQEDGFLKHMISSQMFANFVSEIIEEPDQPEIRFFNEHIIAKRNRSKFSLTKGSTPFLDDPSEDIAQSFTVPGPVTASVPLGQTYSYSAAFPIPDLKQLQIVVSERGLTNLGGAGGLLMREQGSGPETSRLQRGENPEVMRDRVRLQFGPSLGAGSSLNTLRRTVVGMNADSAFDDDDNEDETTDEQAAEIAFFRAAKRRYDSVIRGITKLQAGCRARPARKQFNRKRSARRRLQHWWLAIKLRRVIVRRIRHKAACRLQNMLRALLDRKRFLRTLRQIRIIQSLQRARQWRVKFFRTRKNCLRVQAWFRGVRIRKAWRKKSLASWSQWRRQMLYLWAADSTPLRYRSSFWSVLTNPYSFLNQALHQEEIRRLYASLGLFSAAVGVPKTGAFADQFRAAQNVPLVLKLAALHTSQQVTATEISQQTNAIVDEALRGNARHSAVVAQRAELVMERKLLYTTLRDDQHNLELFRLFSLQDLKKRKQKLSDLVWVCCTEEFATKSAAAVLMIYTGAAPRANLTPPNTLSDVSKVTVTSGDADWAQILRQRRIAFDCAEAAKASLESLSRRGRSKENGKVGKARKVGK